MKKIILVIALLVVSLTQAQNVLIVDNNTSVDTSPSHMFTNFANAQTAAANGDIIYIQPSITAYGNITISKEITVYGIGHTPELNDDRKSYVNNVTIAASNVKVSGLYVRSGNSGSIATSGSHSNITIENNYVYNYINVHTGITNANIHGNVINVGLYLNNSVNATVTNNFIKAGVNSLQYFNSTTIFNNNVVVFGSVTTNSFFYSPIDFVAQNNIFVFTSNFNGTNWQNGGTPTIFNNCLSYSYNGTTIAPMNGSGNFDNTNPQFVSISGTDPLFNVNNDYNIGSGSLGTDGNDIGLYNGYYDFDMRGYPTLLPYLTEMTISNNMVPAGATLNVNLKANANKTN